MARDDGQMKIRLSEALREAILAAADANKRSMNAEIVARLDASFEHERYAGEVAERVDRLEDQLTRLDALREAFEAWSRGDPPPR